MKKVFVLVVAFVATGLFAKAQCDGVTKWNCTKMKIVDQSGNVVNEKEDNIVVLVSNKNITVTPGDDSHKMEGPVIEFNCKWSVPGKTGKTILKSDLQDTEKLRHATVTIEAVDGKMTITLEAPEETTKIVLDVKDYEVEK
jgi:hypothetical protein